jgi:hypothetical protein
MIVAAAWTVTRPDLKPQWNALRHLVLDNSLISVGDVGGLLYQMLLCCQSSPLETIRLHIRACAIQDTLGVLPHQVEIMDLLAQLTESTLTALEFDITFPLALEAGHHLGLLSVEIHEAFAPLAARGILGVFVRYGPA